jgi:hypothetical protein
MVAPEIRALVSTRYPSLWIVIHIRLPALLALKRQEHATHLSRKGDCRYSLRYQRPFQIPGITRFWEINPAKTIHSHFSDDINVISVYRIVVMA